ncbi:glycoside hydrolase family 36 protein [Streptomyces sp. NPDC092369]|uniref:glycoside hydrolase family 36 protein n=1 Tax=Streptomyces sp. NPDC092369 TaxID=3366015 RepID=UPI003807E8BB
MSDHEFGYRWGHSALILDLDFGGGSGELLRVSRPGDPTPPVTGLPLVDVTLMGAGTGWSGPRFRGTALGGARLRYRAHRATYGDGWHHLTVELGDPQSGLRVFAEYASPDGVAVLRSRVRVRNEGDAAVTVRSVGSLLLGGLPSPDVLDAHRARNDWLAECRWYAEPLRASVPDIGREVHEHDSRAALRLTGRGSWPTDGHLAMGALTDRTDGRCWLWQVESAAGWVWDAGEAPAGRTYVGLSGPTYDEHGWSQVLDPGAEFASEYAALALGDGFDGAVGALTEYRRRVRRPHPDHDRLPVVFNDYMNTLMGDPTTEKLLPLIDAAASAGAEYFCVDAGWYDDSGDGGWWDSVGAWQPSGRRFPGGIQEVLERIRERGMVPGVWLEPEVVGVRSPVAGVGSPVAGAGLEAGAGALPDDAFLHHADGSRVTEQGRHQLDLTHPAARAHLDAAVDRIVGEWGVGYLKLDYNITTSAPGLLDHTRAWRAWLASVLDRYPSLVVENCASGGMRMDGASLSVTQLQSTSDQQDPVRYPPIAAAAPTVVPPEQGAVWAYPQPSFPDAEIGFTLGTAMLGRVHLSGHLDHMTERQLLLVREAVATYKAIRGDLRTSVPFWPLGLPGWTDGWIALGLRAPVEGATYVSVWRRGGDEVEMALPVAHLAGRAGVRGEVLHATDAGVTVTWDEGSGLRVTMTTAPAMALIRLT